MPSALMRRSAWAAAVVTMAAVASPLIGHASAATFSGATSSNPAPDSSGVVHANRPTLIGTFSDDLKSGSISVWDKADSAKTNLCGGAAVSGKTVQCTVPADLSTQKTYDAQAHGVRASDSAAADTPVFEFTVAYPVFDGASSVPPPLEAIVSGTEAISTAFSETVSGDSNSLKIYELNPDGTRGNGPLAGTVSFPTTGTPPAAGKKVQFAPSATLADGAYEAVANVNGVNSDGSKNAAAIGTADYHFFIDTAGPKNMVANSQYKDASGNPIVNSGNEAAFPFNGTAAPGTTVTVWVKTGTAFDQTGASDPGATTGSTTVADCDAAPNCPWNLTVDFSNLEQTLGDGNYDWFANTADAGGKSTAFVKGGTVDLSTAMPNPPTNGSAQMKANSGDSIVQVSASPPAACTSSLSGCNTNPPAMKGYEVVITDPESHSVTQDFTTTGSITNAEVDVSGLDNGDLDVAIETLAVDGNVSSPFQLPPDMNNPSPHDPTVTKASPFAPNFGTSTLTGGKDVTFQDAETQPVQPLTKVTAEFNESIKVSYTDTNPVTGTTHNSFVCIAFASGNCDSSIAVSTPTATSDGHGLTFNVTTKIPDGPRALFIRTFSAGCGTTGGTCDTYNQAVTLPAPATGVFNYTIDGTPPKVAITQLTNPISSAGLQTASIAGTTDTNVTAIQLTLKSSNDANTTKIATANASNGTWSLNPLPLSGLVDGTLTVTASGKDPAGNTGTGLAKTLLNGLGLSALAGDRTVLLAWQRPTLANNAAPAYTLTMVDVTRGTGSQLVSPPPSSSQTSFRVSNLVNGDAYAFQLKATDPSGNGPIARIVSVPHTPTTISISSSARTITYGTTVTLTGRLVDSHGYGVGGKRLSLYPVYAGGRKGGAAHPTTNTHGYWSFATKPIANATYVISFGGDSAFGASSRSVAETVRVRIRISSVTAKNSSHTTAVRIAGTVSPNEHGRHVYIYEVRGGKNVRIAMVTLTTKSTFSYTHTWSTGTHTVFARFYSQNGVTGANSPKVKFSRT